MAHHAFDVYLFDGRNSMHMDTVFATGYTAAEMRKSLIEHDGYPTNISVYRKAPDRPAYDDAARCTDRD